MLLVAYNIVATTFILTSLINPTISIPDTIGQPCANDKECKSISILLTCVDSKCSCIDDAGISVDAERNQCVVLESFSCYREGPEFDNKFHYVPCTPHAVCDSATKTCECEERYYSVGNGSCAHQKQYQEPCNVKAASNECDMFRVFNCTTNGQCGCADGLIYNEKHDTCFRPIGSSCARENYFHNPIFPGRFDPCPLEAECYSGICLCRPGFRVSSDQNCGADYGQRCKAGSAGAPDLDTPTPCSDIQFACRNGTCACKYPLHQIYDFEAKACLSIVPGPCKAEAEGSGCVPLAECVKGQCRCLSRYRQNPQGYCVKPHGYDCEFDSECDKSKAELVCVNGQCSCPDFMQKFDRETESCVGRVGARCDLSQNSTCVDGADCTAFGPEEQFGLEWGECICSENGGCSE